MVRENPSEAQKNLPNGRKPVSTVELIADEMQARVRRLAFPGEPGESIKAVLGRVARRSGVTLNEAKRLWYGEGCQPTSRTEYARHKTGMSSELHKNSKPREQDIGRSLINRVIRNFTASGLLRLSRRLMTWAEKLRVRKDG